MKYAAWPIVAMMLLAACEDVPTETNPVSPLTPQIVDATHNAGNEHFFFLPPIVPNPLASGVFDGSLAPRVEICDLGKPTVINESTPCLAPQAPFPITFSTSTGPGSETVRVNGVDEYYIVNWHTDLFNLSVDNTYRIRVLVASTELGHADVDVASNGSQLKNVDTDQFIALKDGRTLPIKFRVEEGAVFVIGSDGGTFTALEGAVEMDIPAGALPGDVGITVEPVPESDVPTDAGLIAGTVFDFQPDGTAFSTGATLTLGYDEANLPAGLPENSLTILTEEAGEWLEAGGSTVDAVANTVTALIDGFSRKAAGGKVTTVDVTPSSATLDPTETVQLTATPQNAAGDPVARQVTWTSLDPGLATVDNTGLATAVAPGTVTIEAKSGSATGTAVITVSSRVVLFTEDFNAYILGSTGTQFETGLTLGVFGSVPGWTGGGINHSHAVDLDPGPGTDWALQFAGGSTAASANRLTLDAGIPANDAGVLYQVSFDAAPTVWQVGSQVTTAVDGVRIDILRSDNSVLASLLHQPGAWPGGPDAQNSFNRASFTYTGDGTGGVRIHMATDPPVRTHFGGAIDNLQVTAIGSAQLAQIDQILNDLFLTKLVTNLTTAARAPMEATLSQCATSIDQNDAIAVDQCVATARGQVGTATDPTDRVLLAVLDRLLEFAELVLNL